jgi:type II secretory pathway component PulL
MARVLNALEIQPGVMRLLRGVASAGGVTVQFYVSEPFAGEQPTTETLHDFFRRHGVLGEKVATCLSPGQVNVRDLEFPFRERGKIRDALPFTIEPLLPYPVDEAVLDFYPLGAANPWPVRAVAVEKRVLQDHLQRLEAAGVTPSLVGDAITALVGGLVHSGAVVETGVDAVAVVEQDHAAFLIVADGRERVRRVLRWTRPEGDTPRRDALLDRLRGAFLAATVDDAPPPSRLVVCGAEAERDGFATALGERLGLPVQVGRLGLPSTATSDGRQWSGAAFTTFGLLLQWARRLPVAVDFHRTHSPWIRELHQLRRHAVAYGVALGLVVALAGADIYASYSAQNRTYQLLREQLRERFERVMPAGTRTVNETAQVKSRIAELREQVAFFEELIRPGGQPLHWLNLLSEVIPQDLDLQVKSLTIDGKDIRLNGTVNDFKAVERLKGILRTTPGFAAVDVRDAKLSVDQKRVRLQLVLTPGAGDAA